MSENSKIEWTDHTWSPWRGCTKVSSGCANCYAEGLANRFGAAWGGWGKGALRVLNKDWSKPLRWNCKVSVFPSLCDWLDEEVPIEWLARFLKLIHDTPNLDWLLLTKRPEKWHGRIFDALLHVEGITDPDLTEQDPETEVGEMLNDWSREEARYAPKNVWIGTSVEDQTRADERIPALLRIPARRRFLSVEPLLGPVDLSMWLPNGGADGDTTSKHNYDHPEDSIHWAIVGGESGAGARPCNVEWIRSIVRQCKIAGVPCFVKQVGSNPVMEPGPMSWPCSHPKGGDPAEWPEDLRVRQFPEVQP